MSLEWTLVCLAYNLNRLHRLDLGEKLAAAGAVRAGHSVGTRGGSGSDTLSYPLLPVHSFRFGRFPAFASPH